MNRLPEVIKEMFILIVASAVIGIAAQRVIPNGIGLRTELTILGSDSSQTAVPSLTINPNGDEDSAENIELLDAFNAHQNGSALFIDARSADDFLQGHISGAINIPVHAFLDSLNFLEELEQTRYLISYCDGADCNASIELAANLKMMGFTRVSFFFGGWQEWSDAGYPVEGSLK